jgi:hypothetical protein
MMVLREKQYTADEFWDMLPEFEDGKRFELVEGVIVEMTGSRPINSKLGVSRQNPVIALSPVASVQRSISMFKKNCVATPRRQAQKNTKPD